MTEPSRTILVTSALPYANGPIHIGHMVEYIQTDIWVRFQRMRGHEVRSFCGDDTHGTATMIRAEKEGREPEVLLEEVKKAQAICSYEIIEGPNHGVRIQIRDEAFSLPEISAMVLREMKQLAETKLGDTAKPPNFGLSSQLGREL